MTEKQIYNAIDPLIKKKYDKRFVRSVSGIDDLLRKKRYTYDLSETEGDMLRLICLLNDLYEENEQLKSQLDYIQSSISKAIKHQKTELGQKALKEIIADYNEWLIGHKKDGLND